MGEYVTCDLCDGKGIVKIKERVLIHYFCPKCKGAQKINWIENIFGKKIITDVVESNRKKIASTKHIKKREYNIISNQEYEYYV